MAQSCSSKCLDVEGGESATQDRAKRHVLVTAGRLHSSAMTSIGLPKHAAGPDMICRDKGGVSHAYARWHFVIERFCCRNESASCRSSHNGDDFGNGNGFFGRGVPWING